MWVFSVIMDLKLIASIVRRPATGLDSVPTSLGYPSH